ncbi:hypothetical protein AEAC466_13980 [Asticcacaulis sp. AC466]|uniref:hypothetical protein n=1 Tax=Asticcacaulis sp. AC466 TaxID=1282362 RepID=UPI0003C3E1F1|nr:hypothetical protein [Asticcacaulis sp. AC466]ESQ83353.1 hypothetical protein AEAC466_13980 [Asticcacaulis sp. AC466]
MFASVSGDPMSLSPKICYKWLGLIWGNGMSDYKLVYIASEFDAGRLGFLGTGVFFMALGLVMILVTRRSNKRVDSTPPRHRIFSWLFFIFAVLWTLMAGTGLGLDWLRVSNALRDNDYHVVEGQVDDFVPMPAEGHADETFRVKGVHFSYSDYTMTAGYRQSEVKGGYIHSGIPVRIGYVCAPSEQDCSDPLIVRLELKDQSPIREDSR